MTNVFSIQKTFEGKVFQVPDYQRGYAWEEPHWEELWEDIEFLATGKNHYTGNLVLHRQPGTIAADDRTKQEIYHIVDGQQRLTTIVILLDCIRERYGKPQEKTAEGIRQKYIKFRDGNGQDAHRLRLNSDCQDYFAGSVVGDSPLPEGETIASHQRLRQAREFFENQIEQKASELGDAFSAWLDEFLDRITQRIKVGHYEVDDSSEVGVIFEVMNNRGKPLSELEKVKNYLMYLASKLAVEDHDLPSQINDAWADIFKRLMSAGLTSSDYEDRLLRAHWFMAYDPARKEWAGSKSIKRRFHLRIDEALHGQLLADVMSYVASLRAAVVAFCDAFTPTRSDTFGSYPESQRAELRVWSEKLARSGVRSPFLPLLMAARLKFPQSTDSYLQLLQALELFEFRVFRWATRRANAGETRLLRLGYELYNGLTNMDSVVKDIKGRALAYLANRDFHSEFAPSADNSFYHWTGIRYLLYEYELHLAKGKDVKIRWDDLQIDPKRTIEHILPQGPTDDYWQARFDADALSKYTHALGNLSLTLDNSSYGNKAYPAKRGSISSQTPCYATASLFMERKIAGDFEDWTPEAIEKRGQQIRDWAIQRWHIDESLADLPAVDEDADDEDTDQ